MNSLTDGESANSHLEETSGLSTRNVENNLIDILETKIENTIDFEAEGYVQIETKGGLRWVKK